MKLTGNRIASALFIMCCLANSNADEPTVELTTFTAGTPAKASEVNGNFEAMKRYIQQLEDKVKALGNGGYNIPVYGDGDLIGYALSYPTLSDPYVTIATKFGEFTVDYNAQNVGAKIELYSSDPNDLGPLAFSDSNCDSAYLLLKKGMITTFVAFGDTVYREQILLNRNDQVKYFIPKGTEILKNINPLNYYRINDGDGGCEHINSSNADTAIALTAYSGTFKAKYNTIKFGDE